MISDKTLPKVADLAGQAELSTDQDPWLVWEGTEGVTYLVQSQGQTQNNRRLIYVKTKVENDLAGWCDVYLKQAENEPKNLSQCDGINCGQLSLSQDGRHGVYIKAQG